MLRPCSCVIALAVTVIALPTAQAANTTLTLACQGTVTNATHTYLKPEPISMGITVNLTAQTITTLFTETVEAQEAQQDLRSANYMLPGCENLFKGDTTLTFRQGVCIGTVVGVAFGSDLLRNSCIPSAGVTEGQIVRVVITYIHRHPERMHEDFKQLALEALHEAWPCR
jgi:Ssp1 endopeptidase immunity protein Rap1a